MLFSGKHRYFIECEILQSPMISYRSLLFIAITMNDATIFVEEYLWVGDSLYIIIVIMLSVPHSLHKCIHPNFLY